MNAPVEHAGDQRAHCVEDVFLGRIGPEHPVELEASLHHLFLRAATAHAFALFRPEFAYTCVSGRQKSGYRVWLSWVTVWLKLVTKLFKDVQQVQTHGMPNRTTWNPTTEILKRITNFARTINILILLNWQKNASTPFATKRHTHHDDAQVASYLSQYLSFRDSITLCTTLGDKNIFTRNFLQNYGAHDADRCVVGKTSSRYIWQYITIHVLFIDSTGYCLSRKLQSENDTPADDLPRNGQLNDLFYGVLSRWMDGRMRFHDSSGDRGGSLLEPLSSVTTTQTP